MNKSDHMVEQLIHCIGCISHVFGMYLVVHVGTPFLIAKMFHSWDLGCP